MTKDQKQKWMTLSDEERKRMSKEQNRHQKELYADAIQEYNEVSWASWREGDYVVPSNFNPLVTFKSHFGPPQSN